MLVPPFAGQLVSCAEADGKPTREAHGGLSGWRRRAAAAKDAAGPTRMRRPLPDPEAPDAAYPLPTWPPSVASARCHDSGILTLGCANTLPPSTATHKSESSPLDEHPRPKSECSPLDERQLPASMPDVLSMACNTQLPSSVPTTPPPSPTPASSGSALPVPDSSPPQPPLPLGGADDGVDDAQHDSSGDDGTGPETSSPFDERPGASSTWMAGDGDALFRLPAAWPME